MKSASATLVPLGLCLFLLAACNKHTATNANSVPNQGATPEPKNAAAGSAANADADRAEPSSQAEDDPHRPACTDASCQEIRNFLKKHYCGESPFANGPDESCDVTDQKKRSAGVKVIADYECKWNESKNETECAQRGQVATEVRNILLHELQRLGMPDNGPGQTYFTVWQPSRVDWLLTQAYYTRRVGDDVELSEVVAVVGHNARVTVLRSLPLKKTNIDTPDVTEWQLLDVADARGDGQLDVILVGDAYEDHWLEVISLEDDSSKTIYSGLGYYL